MQLVTDNRPPVRRDRLLRLAEVETITGCKKTTLYVLMKRGAFPASVPITGRTVAWAESAVLQWVQDRIAAGTKAVAPAGSEAPRERD